MPREVGPGDRMQIRNRGELQHPGTCMVCGNGNADAYVDLGVYFDYEGAMYLCLTCLEQAGETIGMLTLGESTMLTQQFRDNAAALALLREENSVNVTRLHEYDNLFRRAFSDSSNASVSDVTGDDASKVADAATKTDRKLIDEFIGDESGEESVATESAEDDKPVRANDDESSDLAL